MKASLPDRLLEIGVESVLTMDGYDDCILGVLQRYGIDEPVLVYDKEKVLEKIMLLSDSTYDEAEEYYEFNQLGAWVGEGTPAFLVRLPEE